MRSNRDDFFMGGNASVLIEKKKKNLAWCEIKLPKEQKLIIARTDHILVNYNFVSPFPHTAVKSRVIKFGRGQHLRDPETAVVKV